MPSESEPVYVDLAPQAQLHSSKVLFCKNTLQVLKISRQAWSIHSTQRSDSNLLRHMDDVVGTGPEVHPMNDFELYLTDVVMFVAQRRRHSQLFGS